MRPVRSVVSLYRRKWGSDAAFLQKIRNITGLEPREPALYRQAFRHSSIANHRRRQRKMESNERLEYLGDSILGAVVSDYLYRHYPSRAEGWLTEMRSKIVKRKSLNELGRKMGLDQLLEYDRKTNTFHPSMVGNTLEAFIGAIYLDCGYNSTRRFIEKRILGIHLDLDELAETNENYKSQLMEYIQKEKLPMVEYELVREELENDRRTFHVVAKIGEKKLGEGMAPKKKAAEQMASEQALINLNVISS
ncbi:MAG: ribonuclease III [Bacteroidota bacterium]